MSAAIIVTAQGVAESALAYGVYRKLHPVFLPCDYCGTHPLLGEEEGRCRSCGAPLKRQSLVTENDSKPTP